MVKHKNHSFIKPKMLRLAGFSSLGITSAIGVLALFPAHSTPTNAAETIDVAVKAASHVSLSVSPTVEMSASATDTSREFVTGDATMTITTNNPTGYKIFMTTANGNTALTNTSNAYADAKINSLTTATVGNKMTGNTWGYTLGTTSPSATFRPIPENADNAIRSTTTASATTGDQYNLGFGAHIDGDLIAGTYSNSVIVSVVANYVPPTIDQISTMQEMTSYTCSSMEEGKEYQLKDARDNKTYYVTRLSDGHCWMTQNLAYDFKKGTVLTTADSATNWTIPNDMLNIGTAGDTSSTSTSAWKGDHITNSHDSSGNYYSWRAAIANSGLEYGNAGGSICPRGWRLPDRGSFSDFGLTVDAVQQSPYYFTPAGKISPSSGSLNSSYGNTGYYWLSSYSNDTNGMMLLFNSTYVIPDANQDMADASPIRCMFW